MISQSPDSKVHGANMGPTWVLSAPAGPHVGPMNLVIWVICYDITVYPIELHVFSSLSLHWRHNEPDGVSNHQPRDCLLNCLFKCRSKKTSKLRVTGLCVENSPGTGEFSAQKASNAENVFIWWRHHGCVVVCLPCSMVVPQQMDENMMLSDFN